MLFRSSPSLTILSPLNNSTVSGTISVNGSSTDNRAVTSLTISLDGTTLVSYTYNLASITFNYSMNTTLYTNGVHTLGFVVSDAAGNKTAYNSQINIANNVPPPPPAGDITAPTISTTSPVNGSSYTIGNTVTCTGSATDNVGVYSIKFFIDGVLTSTNSSLTSKNMRQM